jgi:hypothetical protein
MAKRVMLSEKYNETQRRFLIKLGGQKQGKEKHVWLATRDGDVRYGD